MTLRGWVGLMVVVVWGVGCRQIGVTPGRFVGESIAVPDDATDYLTAARPEGAIGGNGVEQLNADVSGALTKRGEHAETDGALSAAASWVLQQMNKGRPIDLIGVESAARHFGFGGVVLMAAGFDMRNQDVWRDRLEHEAHNVPITRYGIRVSPAGRSAAIVFGSVEVTYEPIPRALEPGQTVRLKGRVGERFTSCHVYLTKPDGKVDEIRLPDRTVAASFPLLVAGKYQLEVMGDGATGRVVVSNVPLYVGVPEPAASGIEGAPVGAQEAEARMFTLLNEVRRAAGVGSLLADEELREIALGHSTDMVDHSFFGHVSPTTGTSEDRWKRSGALLSIFGENVAEADTPELAHAALVNSPGHRANMLRAEFTHVGIGARKKDNAMFVTMIFGRRPNPSDMPASAAQIESAILESRARKNLTPAAADPIYRASAQAGADAFVNGTDGGGVSKAVQLAIGREVNRLRSGRPGGCVLATELLELSQLGQYPALSLPGLRRFGVGARVHRDSKGTRLSTVFVLEGVPCQ